MGITEELRQTSIFKSVELEDLEALLAVMHKEIFQRDDLLFEKDTPGDSMVFILSGRIRIFIEDEQKNQITFRHYGPGHIVGEFALLDQRPRSASAAAAEYAEVLMLDRDDFIRFLSDRPIIGLGMMRSLAERIRYTTSYLEKIIDWTRMLSNGEYDRAIAEISVTEGDDNIQQLIGTFLQLVRTVQQHEEERKQKRDEFMTEFQLGSNLFSDVGDVTWSDFANTLRARAGQMSGNGKNTP